jgi:hypothetical protein
MGLSRWAMRLWKTTRRMRGSRKWSSICVPNVLALRPGTWDEGDEKRSRSSLRLNVERCSRTKDFVPTNTETPKYQSIDTPRIGYGNLSVQGRLGRNGVLLTGRL